MAIVSLLASFITIVIAIFWIYKNQNWIILFFLRLKPCSKFLGIRRRHNNRQKALESLFPDIKETKKLKSMNLKGNSLVLESDPPKTLLFRLLKNGNKEMVVETLIYFPDSNALQRRKEDMGEDYRNANFHDDIKESLRKIKVINVKFQERVNVRFFQEPEILWNLIMWDNGMLVGWYEPKLVGYQSPCLEIRPDSILWNRFSKYFDSIWKFKSISEKADRWFKAVFPTSNYYHDCIYKYESSLLEYYSRPPSNKNSFVILIGGGAATGKSTLAWELANVLGIRNIISTDMIRQVIRKLSSNEEVLQVETWEAWKFLKIKENNDRLYKGLETQANLLSAAIVSIAEYALMKGMSTIIEGIHILPDCNLYKSIPEKNLIIFFVDSSEVRIKKNYELRKISTHMRQASQQYLNINERISLHKQIIKIANDNKLLVLTGESWKQLIDESLEIVFNHINR